MPRSNRSPFRFRLALFALAITFSLVVGEIAVRGFRAAPEFKSLDLAAEDCVYQRSNNPLLGFELKPNYANPTPDLISTYERTNSHGLRDEERSTQKPENLTRILLLGDSVVEGYGLPQQQTISRQLQELYPKQDTVQVLNFGVSAYCTRAEIELLETKGLQFQPDHVVLVFVENDFDNFNREAFSLEQVERPAIADWGFKQSHLFRLASLQMNWFHFRQQDPADWNSKAIGDNNVSDGLQRFRQLADQYQFEPLIAIWPRLTDEAVIDMHALPDSEQLIVEALASLYGIPSFRLSPSFRAATPSERTSPRSPRLQFSQGDELHPSAEGARVAAAAIFEALHGRIGLTQPSHTNIDSIENAIKQLPQELPNYARVYNRVGNDLLEHGEITEAINQYKLALKEDANNAATHNNLGIAIQHRGAEADMENAMGHFRRAIEIQPDFAEAHVNLGNAIEATDREKAQQHFIRAVQIKPDFVAAHFSLSRSLFRAGRPIGAEAGLGQVLKLDSNHVNALLLIATIQTQQQRYAEAKQTFERLISLEPAHAEALNNLAAICVTLGDRESAIGHLRAAIAADPTHPRASKNLDRLLRESAITEH